MRNTKKPSLIRQIKRLPRDLRSKSPEKRKNAWLTLVIILLVTAMALMGVYVATWYVNRSRILSDSQRYQDMYDPLPDSTASPTSEPAATTSSVTWATSTPAADTTRAPAVWSSATPEVSAGNTSVVWATASSTLSPDPDGQAETAAPQPTHTSGPSVSVQPDENSVPESTESEERAVPTAASAPELIVTPEPMATAEPDMIIAPLATPNEDTLVYALPTAPPVQSSFDELLSLNSETIGFLTIDDVIALPVVQRENDNDYYLSHNFERAESSEGALFLDGANRLVPEDDCLIVYGHNMKNNTMFGRLESYADMTFLKKHAIVSFDTLYENRSYVPFAAFSASMDSGSSHYFDVRQFVFDETSFELFTLKMQTRSIYHIPVDVKYGDRILLLVTCDYANSSGRFILCLRQLREDEAEDAMWAAVQKVTAN